MVQITYYGFKEDYSVLNHPICDFFSSELWNILMMGSILWFGTFSLTLLNLTLYLTLIPEGNGGEVAHLFIVQAIKSDN